MGYVSIREQQIGMMLNIYCLLQLKSDAMPNLKDSFAVMQEMLSLSKINSFTHPHQIQMVIEELLEHFFSIHNVVFNENDCNYFLCIANSILYISSKSVTTSMTETRMFKVSIGFYFQILMATIMVHVCMYILFGSNTL